MGSVSVSQWFDAPPAAVEAVLADDEPLLRAAGFDEVDVDGTTVEVSTRIGLAELSLTLQRVEPDDAVVAYEQREGFFEEMRTAYAVRPTDGGSRVTATTTFELPVPLVGDVLDATVVERKRRRELDAQLGYIQQRLDRAPTPHR